MNISDTIIFNMALALIGFASLFLSIILYTRFSYVMDRNWKASLTEFFQTLLAQYLNTESLIERDKIKNRIIHVANSRERRQILLNQIIQLYAHFSGSFSDLTKDLYQDLRLYRLSLKKIRSKSWHKKIEGMTELSLMNYRNAINMILPLLKHSNRDVRRHARIATIELQKSKGLKHLSHLSTEMSEWTYLSILSILHRTPFKLNQQEIKELKESESANIRSLVHHLEKHTISY